MNSSSSPVENPYAASVVDQSTREPTGPAGDTPIDFRETFRFWELRRRWIYNGILVVWTILLYLVFCGFQADPILGGGIIGGALIANLCYFAGPVAEAYAKAVGLWLPWMRETMFAGGTLIAMFLAACVVGALAFSK